VASSSEGAPLKRSLELLLLLQLSTASPPPRQMGSLSVTSHLYYSVYVCTRTTPVSLLRALI
jgi:hypothetical protein